MSLGGRPFCGIRSKILVVRCFALGFSTIKKAISVLRFEFVEMARKFVLISVLSVVSEDADSYLWTAFIVLFAAQVPF